MNQRNAFFYEYKKIVPALYTKAIFSSSFNNNKTSKISCNVLWDTGASSSAITKGLAKACNLIPIDKAIVQTAGGIREQNVYYIDIALPNNVIISSVRVTELEGLVGNDANALIGMDIISLGDFAISNFEGKTSLTFRMPSCKKFDFVEENEKYKKQMEKTKRNIKSTNNKRKKISHK